MYDQRQLALTSWKIHRQFLHNFALNALNLNTKIQRIQRKIMLENCGEFCDLSTLVAADLT